MAGGGYRGILAAVPTAQNLHSAFRRGNLWRLVILYQKLKIKSRALSPVGASLLAMVVNDDAGCLNASVIGRYHREQARSYRRQTPLACIFFELC